MFGDTITACATAPGTGAIAVIRLSGEKTFPILERVFSKNLRKAPGYTLHHGFIIDPADGRRVDEAVVGIYRAPKSYTGEDLAEISCHGGGFVTGKIIGVLESAGARLALPGEFTERSYLNGKLDLIGAEAVNDIIRAQHDDQLALALSEASGAVRRLLDPLIEEMVGVLGNIEVNIDYPEYQDVAVLTEETVLPKIREWLARIDELLERSSYGKIVREGVTTAIVGKANVGKSSLLNALLDEDKAIVAPVPGTTRDIVEGEIRLRNITLHLLDTAGIRKSGDAVEQIGIRKSLAAIKKAQLVILVLDGSEELGPEDRELLELTQKAPRIIVYNKADRGCRYAGIKISARNAEISELTQALDARYEKAHLAIQVPALSNERQIGLLRQARRSLLDAEQTLSAGAELDLAAVDLGAAHDALRRIEGDYTKEDFLDDIFRRFCLGK